jgi:hypothetical protein
VSASLVKKYRNWIESVGGNTANIFYIVKNHTKYKQLDNMRIQKVMKLKAFRAFDKLSKFSKHDRGGLGEGVNDPGILKAVFLAGGPGSGKTYVTRGLFGIPKKITLSAYGLKVVNSDTELERMLDKYGFGTDLDAMPDELFKQLTDPDYEDYSGLRTRAKELTAARKKLYMDGRLGLIIDGTGDTFSKIKKQKKELEDIGYDCFMVFVHTKLEVAQKRNMERKRKLKPKLVSDSWNAVQANKGAYQGLFGSSNFLLVDNSKTLDEEAAQKRFEMLVKKGVGKFIKKPVQNFRGKNWIKKQKIMKEAYAVRGNKVEKFITGVNVKHKGKRYKEIEYELIKIDNRQEAVLLRILSPKKLFGQKVAVRFQTLRRGPFLKTDTSKTETFSFDGTIPSPSRKLS